MGWYGVRLGGRSESGGAVVGGAAVVPLEIRALKDACWTPGGGLPIMCLTMSGSRNVCDVVQKNEVDNVVRGKLGRQLSIDNGRSVRD